MKLTQEMINQTFAADRFIVINNRSKKPWVPAEPHPRFDYEKGEFIKDEDSNNN